MMHTIRKFLSAAAIAAVLATLAVAQVPPSSTASPSLLSDEEIRKILADRVDVQRKSVGMVVGIVTPRGRRIIPYGRLSKNNARPPDGDTVFEIGSVTKVFTALLLADMARRGEVALNDPVARYLPAGVKVPDLNGRQITLLDLATHTSGLPFAPADLNIGDASSYAKYTDAQLYKFLSEHKLESEAGSKWGYSNLGTALLAKALSRRAGMSYEALVRSRIMRPLGMNSTSVALSPKMKKRLAVGHNSKLQTAPAWESPALPGDGELKSSANDLLTFLSAFMGDKRSPLAPAMASMLTTRRPGPNLQQAQGWWVISFFGPGDDGIVTHGGQTWGYASTVAYDPKQRVGIVVLSNATGNDGGLGWHLLRPVWPMETSAATKALMERKEVSINQKLLDLYAGQYKPEAGEPLTVERQGGGLIFKSSATPPQGLQLYPQDERKFFIKEADLTITFEIDPQRRVTGIVIEFAGSRTLVPRVDPGSPKP